MRRDDEVWIAYGLANKISLDVVLSVLFFVHTYFGTQMITRINYNMIRPLLCATSS